MRGADPLVMIAAQPLSRPRTVLVVDDEDAVRQLLTVILELEGYHVLQAQDGAAALEVAAVQHLDLITLDVMMPGLDGWEVAEALDVSPRTAAVPRVMVSGVPQAELATAPGRTRAAAVLAKPFDFTQLTDVVQRLLATSLVSCPPPRDPA